MSASGIGVLEARRHSRHTYVEPTTLAWERLRDVARMEPFPRAFEDEHSSVAISVGQPHAQ